MFSHELRYHLRQPLTYLFAAALFVIAFATMWGMASEAPGGDNAEVLNSPFRLSFMTSLLSLLLLFLLPSVVGAALQRDYKSRMFAVLYAYPITKQRYLAAKFGAAMLVVVFVVACIGIGFACGAIVPGLPPEVIAPFDPLAYAQLYGVFIVPNMLLFGLITFLIVIRTRNVYLAFIAVIVLVASQAVLSSLLGTADLKLVGALLDPTGDTAIKSVLSSWTVAERNVGLLPLSGAILANRLLWLGISGVLAVACWRSFSFHQFGAEGRRKSGKEAIAVRELLPAPITVHPLSAPNYTYTFKDQLRTVFSLTVSSFRFVVFSWPFLTLLLVGFLTVFLQQRQMSPQFGFETLPTTAAMLRIPMLIYGMTINLVTFIYAGVLSLRGKNSRMGDLIDTTPQPNWVFLTSRLLAIFGVQLLLLSLLIAGGVLTQMLKGYDRYDLWHYVFETYGLHFIHFAIWACMAVFVYAIVRNLYVGFFLLLVIPLGFAAVNELGNVADFPILKDSILQFNTTPRGTGGFAWSDWNGYGDVVGHYLAYKLYWAIGGVLLLMLALRFWPRGYTFSWRGRWMQGLGQKARKAWAFPVACGLTFCFLGAGLYYHDHTLAGQGVSQRVFDQTLALNELRYGRFFGKPQPRIARVKADVAIYPEERNYRASGSMWFVNKLSVPIDTILVNTSFKDEVRFTLREQHRVVVQDTAVRVSMLVLEKALGLGDSLRLDFDVRNRPNAPLWANDRVHGNGTYLLGYHILPQLGVRDAFLSGASKREKYGLGDRGKPTRTLSDSLMLGAHYSGNNQDRILYETTVSTAGDQRAISMGTLQSTWREAGRNYFHYQSEGPIQNNVSWHSGRYEILKDNEAAVRLELNHHPEHRENLEHLRAGITQSLALNSNLFGPLHHDTLRLVEFPVFAGSHATLNGNLIPASESYFLCDVDHADNEVFNVPFFVGAHETAHYWWGHRVDPANVAGGRFITEGLADYLAIRTVEATYGKDYSDNLWLTWRELYFRIRAGRGNETPLWLASLDESHDYLNYRKAALCFRTMSEYLGKDSFHGALASFERRYRFASSPYPSSKDLVAELRTVTPDSLQYLLDDLFTSITLYDNAVTSFAASPTVNGKHQVDVTFTVVKYHADGKGTRSFTDAEGTGLKAGALSSLPLRDYVDLAFYQGKDLLMRQRVKVKEIENTISATLSMKPDRVVLDPENLLLDAELKDNVWELQ